MMAKRRPLLTLIAWEAAQRAYRAAPHGGKTRALIRLRRYTARLLRAAVRQSSPKAKTP